MAKDVGSFHFQSILVLCFKAVYRIGMGTLGCVCGGTWNWGRKTKDLGTSSMGRGDLLDGDAERQIRGRGDVKYGDAGM